MQNEQRPTSEYQLLNVYSQVFVVSYRNYRKNTNEQQKKDKALKDSRKKKKRRKTGSV